MTHETTIERDGIEINLEIEYSFYKGCRGRGIHWGAKPGQGQHLNPMNPQASRLRAQQIWKQVATLN